MCLKNQVKPEQALQLTDLQTSSTPAKHTELILHRISNTHFLYQVWVAASEVGREFLRYKTEIRMAMNGTKAETVAFAADIAVSDRVDRKLPLDKRERAIGPCLFVRRRSYVPGKPDYRRSSALARTFPIRQIRT